MRRRHAVGDVARVIGESLRDVRGRVALGTVSAPGGTFNSAEASAWNLGAGKQWRLLRDRIKREMSRKYRLRPPVVLVRVAQRQGRGLDHLHIVWWCVNAEHEERIRRWVELYREHNEAYGFGFIDDPFRRRESRRTGRVQDMVFGQAEVYLGNYLGGGQLERFVAAEDASWRAYWISPVLQQRSGWSMSSGRAGQWSDADRSDRRSYRSRDVEHADLVRHPSLSVLVRRRRVAGMDLSRHEVGRSSGV